MNRQIQWIGAALAMGMVGGAAATAAPMTLVRDTWQDGDRTTPPAPTYSEAGVDGDADGDLESAWFNGGEGSVMTASPGNLRLDPAAGPATWTTYFVQPSSFSLDVNDYLLVTWKFRTGDVNASNAEQNFRIAVARTAPSIVLTSDGSPPAGVYPGIALFGNMAETTGSANAFQLRRRGTPPAGPVLEDADAWSPLVNGLGAGAVGYEDDTEYTFTMKLKQVAGDQEITATMTGGNIGGTGSVSLSLVHDAPTGGYDTVSLYVANEQTTASFLDTKLFLVELFEIPEPPSALLTAMSGLAVVGMRRTCRRT
jgi:hypothetical protein